MDDGVANVFVRLAAFIKGHHREQRHEQIQREAKARNVRLFVFLVRYDVHAFDARFNVKRQCANRSREATDPAPRRFRYPADLPVRRQPMRFRPFPSMAGGLALTKVERRINGRRRRSLKLLSGELCAAQQHSAFRVNHKHEPRNAHLGGQAEDPRTRPKPPGRAVALAASISRRDKAGTGCTILSTAAITYAEIIKASYGR